MKIKLFLVLYLSFNTIIHAQTWDFVGAISADQSDKCITVKTDLAGNIIVSGYVGSDLPDFNFGNNIIVPNIHPGGKEMFVAKYTSSGICTWAKAFGQNYDDRLLGMDVDMNGDIYITGTFWDNMTLGGVPLGNNGFDECVIAKLDKNNGNILWANYTGGILDNQGLDIAVDGLGFIYVAGFYFAGFDNNWFGQQGILTLGNSGLPFPIETDPDQHLYKYWIAKMDPTGAFLWGKNFGDLPFDLSANKYVERDIAICIDEQNQVYVGGGFDFTQTFGNFSLTSNGGHDFFALKMDDTGTILWAKGGGSDKDDWANGITVDSLGHVYMVGEHRNEFQIDSVVVKNYDKRDVFVLKLDANNGTCIWGKRAGSDGGSERANDVYANKDCKVYVVGDIGQKANFGSVIETPDSGGISSFVSRISKDGNWLWAITGGSSDSSDRCNSVDLAPSGKIYAAGFYKLIPDFGGLALNNLGKTDGYFAVINDAAVYSCEDTYVDLGPILIPNIFTPNNDSINEHLYIANLPENSALIILNRWGTVVFESTAYNNDWKGQDQDGQALKDGVYTYRLTTLKPEKFFGFFHLIR